MSTAASQSSSTPTTEWQIEPGQSTQRLKRHLISYTGKLTGKALLDDLFTILGQRVLFISQPGVLDLDSMKVSVSNNLLQAMMKVDRDPEFLADTKISLDIKPNEEGGAEWDVSQNRTDANDYEWFEKGASIQDHGTFDGDTVSRLKEAFNSVKSAGKTATEAA